MVDAAAGVDIDSKNGANVTEGLQAAENNNIFKVFLNRNITGGLSDQERDALKVKRLFNSSTPD
jgi:hypothetical protein